MRNDLGVNLYIKPTYSVVMRKREPKGGVKSLAQKLNEQNLLENKPKGGLSKKAQQRLVNAVNWLILSAKNKRVFDKDQGKSFYFKVNFVTLTIPNPFQSFSDNFFKKVLLHNWINQMRYRHDLKNFVWKVETQANGNIHVHITTDTYLPYKSVRDVWNRILEKNGIMKDYTNRMNKLTMNDYIRRFFIPNKTSIPELMRRFREGQAKGWGDPNTTDVHAVHKVKDVGAYLSKYFAKNEDDRREVDGRIWACSYSISRASKLTVNIPYEYGGELIDQLNEAKPKVKYLEYEDTITGQKKWAGTLYFYALDTWDNLKNGQLKSIVNRVRYMIRHNLFNEDDDMMMGIA